MSRGVVWSICIISVLFFAGLVYYGWTHRWGGPMDTTVVEPAVLTMQRLDKTVTLDSPDMDAGIWEELAPVTIPLLHQVTAPPRGTTLVPRLDVRAFHDGRQAYFLFEWKDDEESRTHGVAEFPDCVAVAFSLAKDTPNHSIMMGFQSPVNIWQWKANLDSQFWNPSAPRGEASPNDYYTYEENAAFPERAPDVPSACQDIVAARPGTVTLKENIAVSGRGQWHDGTWRVIVTRSLTTNDPERDVQLQSGKTHIAFAVWNGDKGDRGSRKSMSEWVILDMQAARTAARGSFSSLSTGKSLRLAPILSLAGPAVTEAPQQPQEDEEPRVINITARRFEYEPSKITLQKGELVTFRLESLDVTHGLYLDGYGIQLKARPGLIGKATFRADKPGRFTFRCSETCGEFHPYMIGFLTVEPNSRFNVFFMITVGGAVVLALVVVSLVIRKSKGAA